MNFYLPIFCRLLFSMFEVSFLLTLRCRLVGLYLVIFATGGKLECNKVVFLLSLIMVVFLTCFSRSATCWWSWMLDLFDFAPLDNICAVVDSGGFAIDLCGWSDDFGDVGVVDGFDCRRGFVTLFVLFVAVLLFCFVSVMRWSLVVFGCRPVLVVEVGGFLSPDSLSNMKSSTRLSLLLVLLELPG